MPTSRHTPDTDPGLEIEQTEAAAEHLATEDITATLRLLGDLASQIGTAVVRRRELMTRLAQMIGADEWLWFGLRLTDDQTLSVMNMVHSDLNERVIKDLLESFENSQAGPPENQEIARLAALGAPFTRTRPQLFDRETWAAHPHVRRSRHPNDFDEFVISAYPLETRGMISLVGLHRRVGRAPFGDRERLLVHLLMSSLHQLHHEAVPDDQSTGDLLSELTPRQRTVFSMLLNGWNRKQIATNLGLSPYTVADHMKAIYKHFGVNSQRELLHKFMTGGHVGVSLNGTAGAEPSDDAPES